MWGATAISSMDCACSPYFNPRSPCGERQGIQNSSRQFSHISIHAPRVGSDSCSGCLTSFSLISIHAPRVGSDSTRTLHCTDGTDFNPRSPCGERRYVTDVSKSVSHDFNPRSPCGERPTSVRVANVIVVFQSTLPVWGATRLDITT